MPPQNHAVYLVDKHGKPLEVRPAPYTTPGTDELVIEVKAIAINPVDIGMQLFGSLMFPWIKYPAIVGNDVSGVVVEVGSGKVSKLFRPGDRVVGHAVGTDKRSNNAAEGAFQKYTVLRYDLTSKIPGSLSHEQASVLPLGLSTAACGLFMKDYLALRVGSDAVQLAHAAGYEVLATASPKNSEYLKSIGASKVFDYKQASAVRDIISALQNKTCAGAIAIGDRSLEACIDIVGAVPGRKFVSQANNPVEMSDMPTGTAGLVWTILKLRWWNFTVGMRAKFKGVSTKTLGDF
ncbi:zinc-binding oxidoreductase CipB [Daldinia bambusicola]|nr:zinc-binding oxidoreductase CipB [Daldinia bambusicola]